MITKIVIYKGTGPTAHKLGTLIPGENIFEFSVANRLIEAGLVTEKKMVSAYENKSMKTKILKTKHIGENV